ncbi:hypothetical protein ABIC01_005589 [Bradyrhizobium sp. RT4b]
MTQDGAGEPGEEALDKVKPGAVLGREGVKVNWKRPAGRVSSQALVSLDMWGGMIIEDQLDRGPSRIGGIEELKESYELSAAVAVFDERVDLPCEPVSPANRLSVR